MLSLSAQKQIIPSKFNDEEIISLMTIRMLKRINVSQDKTKVCLDNMNISYIQVVARIQQIKFDVDKVSVFINDDTGIVNVQFLIQTQIDNEHYQKLRKGKPQNDYFIFLFRCRIYRLMPFLDIVNVQQITQSSFIYFHYLNLIQQNLTHFLNPQIKQQCFSKQTLTQNESNETLEQRILQFMLIQRELDKTIQFQSQLIINQFIETDKLNDIKDALNNLMKKGRLSINEADKTYLFL